MKKRVPLHKNQSYFFFLSFLMMINICIGFPNSKYKLFRDIPLSLSTTSTWHEFQLNNPKFKKEKCVWISYITFKSKEAVNLKRITLKWLGNFINTKKISASLYQKKENNLDLLIPIEENLVCDGKWNKKKQEIIFNLNEKLVAINKYYLVLNFPQILKSDFRNGKFVLRNNASIELEKLEPHKNSDSSNFNDNILFAPIFHINRKHY